MNRVPTFSMMLMGLYNQIIARHVLARPRRRRILKPCLPRYNSSPPCPANWHAKANRSPCKALLSTPPALQGRDLSRRLLHLRPPLRPLPPPHLPAIPSFCLKRAALSTPVGARLLPRFFRPSSKPPLSSSLIRSRLLHRLRLDRRRKGDRKGSQLLHLDREPKGDRKGPQFLHLDKRRKGDRKGPYPSPRPPPPLQ